MRGWWDAICASPEHRIDHLVVLVHNHLWWPIARRLVRVVEFSDGTFMVGWRWSKSGWLVQ